MAISNDPIVSSLEPGPPRTGVYEGAKVDGFLRKLEEIFGHGRVVHLEAQDENPTALEQLRVRLGLKVAPEEAPLDLEVAPEEVQGPLDLEVAPEEVQGPLALEVAPEEAQAPLDLEVAPEEAQAPLDLEVAPEVARGPLDLEVAPEEAQAPLELEVAPEVARGPLDLEVAPEEAQAPLDLEVAPEEARGPLALEVAPEGVQAPLELKVAPEEVQAPLDVGDAPEEARAPLELEVAPEEVQAPLDVGVAPEEARAPLDVEVAPEEARAPLDVEAAPEEARAPLDVGVAPERLQVPIDLEVGPERLQVPIDLEVGPAWLQGPLDFEVAPERIQVPLDLEVVPAPLKVPLYLGVAPKQRKAPLDVEVAPKQRKVPLYLAVAPEVAFAIPPPRAPEPSGRFWVQEMLARWSGHIDPTWLRRVTKLSTVIGGTFLLVFIAYSQRERLSLLGRSAAATDRSQAEWLEHRDSMLRRASPSPPPQAVSPAPPESSTGPAHHEDRVAVTGTQRTGGSATAQKKRSAATLAGTSAAVGRAVAGAFRAHDVSREPGVTDVRPVRGPLVSPPEAPAGSHQHLLTPLYDPLGNPVGWRLWLGGPRSQMAAAFDELSLWCSGRFGAGQPLGRLAEAGEWGTARWASPLAEVEMHGRTNSLGDTRIWSVDLRGGVIKAVEDAEVELTYLRGNPP